MLIERFDSGTLPDNIIYDLDDMQDPITLRVWRGGYSVWDYPHAEYLNFDATDPDRRLMVPMLEMSLDEALKQYDHAIKLYMHTANCNDYTHMIWTTLKVVALKPMRLRMGMFASSDAGLIKAWNPEELLDRPPWFLSTYQEETAKPIETSWVRVLNGLPIED